MGLESLNENLSEARAELVFAQRALQFKPPLEELRAAYYRDTKKFVSIPNTFEGFGNGKVRLFGVSGSEPRGGRDDNDKCKGNRVAKQLLAR